MALFASPGTPAQDSDPVDVEAAAVEEGISLEDLGDRLHYYTKSQLEQLAGEWLAKVQASEKAIANASIANRKAGSDAEKEKLRTTATQLREERGLRVERLEAVLEALESKGGDAEEARLFVYGLSGALSVEGSDPNAWLQAITAWLVSKDGGILWGLSILKFIGILFFALVASRLLGSLTNKAVSRMRTASELLRVFLGTTVRKVVFFVGFVVALGALGVPTGPFMAAIGAAGFVIGFALQGTLGNFAAGVMILLYRPFDIGNVVNVAGVTGKVEKMSLVSTTVLTPDNQMIVVPNSSIWGDVITNINGLPTRRVDLVFGIGYEDDIGKAKKILAEVLDKHDKVLADPEPMIRVGELADSSVNILCRPWAKTEDYWDVHFDVLLTVKERFDAAGISIPFPQRDIHLYSAGASAEA
jgi:small conductance mechanosensitive channel